MEEPYGLCDSKHNTPMSDCRIDCRTREIVSVCGCGDVYMSYMKNDTDSKSYAVTLSGASENIGQFVNRRITAS